MNFLTKKLYRYYLPKLVKKKCDEAISRTGETGKKTNCYIVFLHQGVKPYLVIEDTSNDELNCLKWDGERFSENVSINIQEADNLKLKIEHYYGLYQVSYFGIYDFLIEQVTQFSYLKINAVRFKDFIFQYIFNRRSLETKQRFDFLKLLTTKFIGSDNGFSYVSVMSEMHSDRSFLHPEFNKEASKIQSYLNGFVDTGELKIINHDYHLTGFAYKAINEYEEQERKHKSAIRIQYIMIVLTLALVFFTIVQAGLIKLPIIFDLS